MRQSLAQRYLPFFGIAAVLLALQILQPVGPSTQEVQTGAAPGAAGTPIGSTGAPMSDFDAGVPVDGGGGGGTAAAPGATTGSAGAGGPAGPAAGGGGPAAVAGGQRVDALGRPLDGDRSGCAPGGQLQQDVTTQRFPCVPELEGPNGGATYQGVTADKITVAQWGLKINEANSALLTAVDFEMSQQQYEDAVAALEIHFNKRYNLYGRQLEVINFYSDCSGTTFGESPDPTCFRADAKAINAKYKPFAVTAFAAGASGLPLPMADELARLGIINFPNGGTASSWYNARRPFSWQFYPHGDLLADMGSEYFCKKAHGKNATRAGDPAFRVTTRKLGITTFEDPEYAESAERVKANVTGGMCGAPDEGTTVYTFSSDANRRADQMPTLIARMKQDGITTTYGLNGPPCEALSPECDNQNYFPEHILSGTNTIDCDACGRFQSATQRRNMFGLGFYPASRPLREFDFHKAIRDGNPQYDDPPYLTEIAWKALAVVVPIFQAAGPNLTPQNVERGAFSLPQINGWENPNPWPGWKCCDPFSQMGKFGPGDYTMQDDAREISHFDETRTSPVDGKQGMWIGTEGDRRRALGSWPAGDVPSR